MTAVSKKSDKGDIELTTESDTVNSEDIHN